VGIDATVTAGGAAGANGGILRAGTSKFHHDAVRAMGHKAERFYRLTAAEIDRIEKEAPEAVRRTGSLRVASDDAEWADCVMQVSAMHADKIAAEARETPFGRGVFVAHDASVQPVTRGRALARMAIERGARLFEHTRAIRFAGDEVVTPQGRIRCAGVVVAVDGGLEDIVPEVRDSVRTTRLQMLATEPATDVSIPCPVSLNYGYDYFQQLEDGRVVLGGGRNRAFDHEWGAPAEPSDEIQSYLDTLLRDRIGTKARVTHRWAARVAYREDGGVPPMFCVRNNAWVVGGYNGTGNLLGSLYGRGAARKACGLGDAGLPVPTVSTLEKMTVAC
jgi:gamma-glutamylputrescine oxidase